MASAAVNLVINKLGQLAINEAKFLLGLEDDIENMKMKLEWLSTFLADADQKRRDKQHELVGLWVRQLREVAYNLDDVLDEYTAKLDVQRMGFSRWIASPLLHRQLSTRHDLASQIAKIKAKLEEISKNKATYLDHTILSLTSQDSS